LYLVVPLSNLWNVLIAEIPNGTKKVCSSCFTRIMRKINQHSGGNCASPAQNDATATMASGNGTDSGVATTSASSSTPAAINDEAAWTDDQTDQIKTLLKAHGRNWNVVAEKLGGGKTSEQCKKFFYTNRKKLNLDKIVLEYKRVRGKRGMCCYNRGDPPHAIASLVKSCHKLAASF
jgi:glycosidase